MSGSGTVYLVGAGPGDPGLFTLRGVEVLRRAEAVIYDGLVTRELLRFAPPTAEIIYGGKHDRTRCVSQDQLNALLVAKAREGKCVVRLKGGDPFVFGRGGEEAEVLAEAGIPFEVVPGVSSSYSVPSYAGIPLTFHASRITNQPSLAVTLVTGHDGPSSPANKVDWSGLAKVPGTLVVMMGLRNVESVAATLIAHGRPYRHAGGHYQPWRYEAAANGRRHAWDDRQASRPGRNQATRGDCDRGGSQAPGTVELVRAAPAVRAPDCCHAAVRPGPAPGGGFARERG